VDFVTDTPKTSPNQPDKTEVFAAFASLVVIVAAKTRRPDGRGRPSPHGHGL